MLANELTRLRSAIAHRGTAREIDAALMPIASEIDSQAIGPLLLMLNDETEDDAMWSLVHAAEQFDDVTYVQHFLSVFPALVVGSSRWASILTMRLLNSDASRAELARQARTASAETRKALVLTCEGINGRDARFLAKTTTVLLAASNDS